MNIQTIRDNLHNAIEGKKNLLRDKYCNDAELSRLSDTDLMMWNVTAKFIRISITEMEKILRDIDSCIKKDGTISWDGPLT